MVRKQIPGQQDLESYRLPQASVRLRLEEEGALYSSEPLESPEKATAIIKKLLQSMDRELVCVCNLDVHLRPINFNVVSIGGISYAPVEIGMLFRTSILTSNCCSVILYHNHPSGRSDPSGEDVEMTKRVSQAGALLGIPLIDHIIIGGGSNPEPEYSFRKHYTEFFSGVYDPEFIRDMLATGDRQDGVSPISGNDNNIDTAKSVWGYRR